jgi:hypothetical protein
MSRWRRSTVPCESACHGPAGGCRPRRARGGDGYPAASGRGSRAALRGRPVVRRARVGGESAPLNLSFAWETLIARSKDATA